MKDGWTGEIGDGLDGTVSRSNQPVRIYHEEKTNGSQRRDIPVRFLAQASKRSTAIEMRMSRRGSIRFKREKERGKRRTTRKGDRRHWERCPDVLSGRTGGTSASAGDVNT